MVCDGPAEGNCSPRVLDKEVSSSVRQQKVSSNPEYWEVIANNAVNRPLWKVHNSWLRI